jgi:very-short-patch-repair endonuclease
MNIDSDMRRLAERQHGVIGRDQLSAPSKLLRVRVARGEWDLPTPRVLRLVGSPTTHAQTLMIAVLDGGRGTFISCAAAGSLWRLPSFDGSIVETSRQRGTSGRGPAIGTLHLPRYLPEHHTTMLSGIPVTSLARTIFDVAPRLHPKRLERVVDNVVAKSPGMLRALHTMLAELAEHGRDGIVAMREVLEERPNGYIAPASGLEARFRGILIEAGEAPFDRQVDLGRHEWIGRVDFVDLDLGLIVEIDSALHHTSRLDQLHDEARDEALLAAGWRRVLRIRDVEVWGNPSKVVRKVRQARAELRLTRFGT